MPLKKSPEYRTLRPRIAEPRAADSWQEEGLHFFVFELKPVAHQPVNVLEPPVVVFTMHPEDPVPVSVVVVTPSASGTEAEVLDLRQPQSAYTTLFPGARLPEHAVAVGQHSAAPLSDPEPRAVGAPGVWDV